MKGSQPPPGRPVKPLLPHADATRSQHLRTLLHDGTAGRLAVVGVGAVVLFGLVERNAEAFLFGLLAMPFVVFMVLVALADRRAAVDFFRAYASARGFDYVAKGELMPVTPLLVAGDRRHAEHLMKGRLPGSSRPATIAQYTFEVRDRLGGDDHDEYEPYHFTVCLVDVPEAFPRFSGVHLRPALPALTPNWLGAGDRREVELESVEFHAAYRLLASAEQDPGAVRELFAPALVVRLVDEPTRPGLELGAGGLCVYVPGKLEHLAGLDGFLGTARELLEHVEHEIAEAGAYRPLTPSA